jgi:regulator of cell morphogenesis and NO signaling
MARTTDKGASRAPGGSPERLEEVLSQLEEEHESVLRKEIPRLQELLHAADAAEGARYGGVFRALNEELARLWFEVEQHLKKEEDVLFPFIRELERNGTGSGAHISDLEGLRHEHENACDRLSRIRRLTGNYGLPAESGRPMRELYMGLSTLEDALRRHIELEDGILIPRAMVLAEKLRRG